MPKEGAVRKSRNVAALILTVITVIEALRAYDIVAALSEPRGTEVMGTLVTNSLTGDPIAVHLHGPAEAGANAGVMVNFAAGGVKMPLDGQATLTDEQAAAFTGGKTYINVHTPANKGGEIRGQVKP